MKRFVETLFKDIIYSNLFIAICAVLMCVQTFQVITETPADYRLLGFVFFATLCSYSFHWYLGKDDTGSSERMLWLRKYAGIHVALFCIGLAGAAYFILPLWHIWPWLTVAIIATFLYSAPKIPHILFRSLRKVALGKTIFLAFVWMYVTSVLPIILSEQTLGPKAILYIAGRFFFIYAICIIFDYRDREYDRAAGVKSLITYLKETTITKLFYTSLVFSVILTLWMLFYGLAPLVAFILILPCVVTALLYNHSRKNINDLLYYFILDGLMALSALLMQVMFI